MNSSYELVRKFMKKYPLTVAWRLRKHAKIIDRHLNPGEKILYVFAGQKNDTSLDLVNTNIVALTDKRIMVATKRVFFGYFFMTITPDMFNDLTVRKGIIFGDVVIDTIKEQVVLSNIDPKGLHEIETVITEYMMHEKKKYPPRDEKK